MARPKTVQGETQPVSFRLPVSYTDRLEKAKWELRMAKVDVVKLALDDLFKKHKIK